MRRIRDGSDFRRERLHLMKKTVEEKLDQNGGMMSLKKFIAWVDWEMGLRPRKAMEYMETLRNLELIDFSVEDDYLTLPRED